MSNEPNTGLTWQEANSLTTDALHNQVVDLLAVWLNCVVLSVGQAAPTGSEVEGDRYIVGTGTGLFAGMDGKLAILRGGTWQFHAPPEAGVPIIKNLDDGADWECVSGAWAAKAGGGGSPTPRHVLSAYRNTAASSGAGAWAKIMMDSVPTDTGSMWDAANTRAIPTLAGWYQVTVRARTSTSGTLVAGIYKNGSLSMVVGPDISGAAFATGGDALIYCNGSTDYIEPWAFSDSPRAITALPVDTYFQIIGPLA